MSTHPEFTVYDLASAPNDALVDRYITEEAAYINRYLMQLRGNRNLALDEPLSVTCDTETLVLGAVSRTVTSTRLAVQAGENKNQRLYDITTTAGAQQPVVIWEMAANGVNVEQVYEGGDRTQDFAYLQAARQILYMLCDGDFNGTMRDEQ